MAAACDRVPLLRGKECFQTSLESNISKIRRNQITAIVIGLLAAGATIFITCGLEVNPNTIKGSLICFGASGLSIASISSFFYAYMKQKGIAALAIEGKSRISWEICNDLKQTQHALRGGQMRYEKHVCRPTGGDWARTELSRVSTDPRVINALEDAARRAAIFHPGAPLKAQSIKQIRDAETNTILPITELSSSGMQKIADHHNREHGICIEICKDARDVAKKIREWVDSERTEQRDSKAFIFQVGGHTSHCIAERKADGKIDVFACDSIGLYWPEDRRFSSILTELQSIENVSVLICGEIRQRSPKGCSIFALEESKEALKWLKTSPVGLKEHLQAYSRDHYIRADLQQTDFRSFDWESCPFPGEWSLIRETACFDREIPGHEERSRYRKEITIVHGYRISSSLCEDPEESFVHYKRIQERKEVNGFLFEKFREYGAILDRE